MRLSQSACCSANSLLKVHLYMVQSCLSLPWRGWQVEQLRQLVGIGGRPLVLFSLGAGLGVRL